MIAGVVRFPVDDRVSEPFAAPGLTVTLYNLGTSIAWTSTRANVDVGRGIPLTPGGAMQWDADKPCFARCAPGEQTTLLASDNSSPVIGAVA